MTAALRDLHENLGLQVTDVRGPNGRVRGDAWLVDRTVLVRVVSVWLALWCLLLNRPFEGVMLVRRKPFRRPVYEPHGGKLVGYAEPDEGAPDVILDWETYVRMVAGLKRAELASVDQDEGEV